MLPPLCYPKVLAKVQAPPLAEIDNMKTLRDVVLGLERLAGSPLCSGLVHFAMKTIVGERDRVPRSERSASKPELPNQGARRKPNPKSDPEKLDWLKMCQSAGREEDSHHRARDRDAEQDGYSPDHPAPFQKQFAAPQIKVSAGERVQKQGAKHQNRRPFSPAANRIGAHRVGGDSNNQAERKQRVLLPPSLARLADHEKWRNQNKEQGRQDVCQSERRVRGEPVVEGCHLRRSGARGIEERERPPNDCCYRNQDTSPEPDA